MVINRKNFDTRQRFGLRKLSVGTCSVLLATLFLGVSIEQGPKVHADVVDQNAKTNSETASGGAEEDTFTLSKDENSVKNSSGAVVVNSTTPTIDTVSDSQVQSSVTAKPEETVLNANSQSGGITENSRSTSESVSQVAASLQEETEDSNQLKADSLNQVFAATANSASNSEVDQIKTSAAVALNSTDGRYTLYISRTSWGNTTDGNQPIKILLSGNVLAGDIVTVSIPSYGIVGVTQPTLDPSYGSATLRDVGNNKVLTFKFTTSGVINPIISIPSDNGYGAKATPMAITMPTEKTITWKINGIEQQSANLLIDINPVWNPSGLKRTDPNPDSTDPNALKKLIPDFKTVYTFSVNESNGVAPGQDGGNIPYGSAKINSAVNYGTVITIPMPEGFVLDQNATMELNNFSDKTTITQSDKNIIITVPKGAGTQNWNSGPAYRIVGSYNISMPEKATTLTADAPITIVQNLNEDGSVQKTWQSATPVSEEFYGADENIPLGSMPLYGGTAYGNKNILNNGQKQIVSYFGVTNQAIEPFDNYSGSFIFDFDEELGVTEIKTPTIPGTTNYKYTITYVDGTTSEGQVTAGQPINGTKIIAKITISPDTFNQDQTTATQMPNNNFADQKQTTTNAFEVYGSVASTVTPKTVLKSSMTFTGAITQGSVTKYLSNTINLSQTVYSQAALTSSTWLYGYQSNTATGQPNVGYLSVYAGGGLTNNIYEPIFYYVLPEWFSVYNFSNDYTKLSDFVPNTNNGVTGEPKISIFAVPTGTPGLSRQVVKIDYTGTGYNFRAGLGANNRIHLNTLPDGVNGTYQGMVYIISPTTELTNTAYNAANTSNFAPAGTTFNPAWVQNNTANLYYVGSSNFTINQVGGANTVSVAQGNQNEIFVDSSTSNVYGSDEMQYAVRLINESGNNLSNVVALINLPQATDNNGTSFTFQLTERPVYDGDKTGYTFLYSTEIGNLKSNNDSDGTKPDETGYVPADQVTDWTKIKSIIVKTSSMSANERSERLIFTGIDPNLAQDAGKVGYISTGFYSDTTKPFISSKTVYDASTVANKVKPGNISIIGESTINFQLHYIDENGQEHTVDLPELQTTYNDDGSAKMMTEQEAINKALANAAVKAQIPVNYEIKSAKLQTGPKTWLTDAPGGTAEFGATVQYFYNGSTVILEAGPIQRTITYTVIDKNDPSIPVTITPSTDLKVDGKPVTGNQGSEVPVDATTAYNSIKSQLESEGYVISADSSTVPTDFGADNTALTIYVTHGTTKVSSPDQWPQNVTSSNRVDLSKNIIRTITVTGLPIPVTGATQNVTYTRTAVIDNVTHEVIGYVNPSDTSQTISDGDQAWTSADNTWLAFTPENVPGGYSISTITSANGSNYSHVLSENGKLTGVSSVVVPANGVNENVTITYVGNPVTNTITFVDADNQDKQVGDTQTINGTVGQTQDLQLTIPAGYELQAGQTLPTSYKFGATNTPIVIKLVHKMTPVGPKGMWPSTSTDADKVPLTENISRTINVNGLPSPVAPIVQDVEFARTAIVDEVTGKVVGYVDPSDSTQIITNGDDAWVVPADSAWAQWTNSNVPEGYYINKVVLPDGSNYSEVTEQDGSIITSLNNVDVTPSTNSTVVNVNYAKVDLDLTINHATVINIYNGDSQPVSTDVISAITHTVKPSNSNVSVTNIAQAISSANLTADDYSYTDSKGNILAGAPTEVGSYRIILNQNGLSKLNQVAGGLTINYDPSKSYVNYNITPASIVISGNGSQTNIYTGTTPTIDPSNFPITLTPEGQGPVPTIPSGTLTSGDFVVKDNDGNTVTPTETGDYKVYLTPEGIEKLNKLYPNYGWPTTDQEVGTLTITPANMNVTMSGIGSKVSDGKPANVDLSTLVDSLTGEKLNKSGLTPDDFSWNTPDGSAPSTVGTYTIRLNENGLKKLQENNPNYKVTVTGSYTYTITAASQKVEYVDEDGKVIKTIDNISSDRTNYGDTIDFDAQGNLPTNYELVDPSQTTLGIKVINGITQIKVKAATEATTETRTVTRTIIVEKPDGTTTTITQPVTFTRTVTTNKVTSEKTYGEWNQSTGTWGEYTPTAIPGYTVPNVPAETVTPDTTDKTVKISYTKNPPVATIETKTVIRTIIVEMPDGQQITVKQTVTFTRTKYTDVATGEVTYGEWDKGSGEWGTYNAPEIDGYISTPVPKETVTPSTDDKTVVVTYTKKPFEPVNPDNPDQPVTPDNPDQPATPDNPVTPEKPSTSTEVPGTNGGVKEVNNSANVQSNDAGQKQATLPQTGNENNELGAASGLLAAILGLFGLAGIKKRKE